MSCSSIAHEFQLHWLGATDPTACDWSYDNPVSHTIVSPVCSSDCFRTITINLPLDMTGKCGFKLVDGIAYSRLSASLQFVSLAPVDPVNDIFIVRPETSLLNIDVLLPNSATSSNEVTIVSPPRFAPLISGRVTSFVTSNFDALLARTTIRVIAMVQEPFDFIVSPSLPTLTLDRSDLYVYSTVLKSAQCSDGKCSMLSFLLSSWHCLRSVLRLRYHVALFSVVVVLVLEYVIAPKPNAFPVPCDMSGQYQLHLTAACKQSWKLDCPLGPDDTHADFVMRLTTENYCPIVVDTVETSVELTVDSSAYLVNGKRVNLTVIASSTQAKFDWAEVVQVTLSSVTPNAFHDPNVNSIVIYQRSQPDAALLNATVYNLPSALAGVFWLCTICSVVWTLFIHCCCLV
jgi:hypothetical protein